jgi:23S rRNA pseudouridine2457 synthase
MYIYIKFYKPFEVLCQFTDKSGRLTLKDFILVPNVYPVGRLDYRSEGLLLLTNNGALAHKLTDPRYLHKKTYLVQVEGVVTKQVINILNSEIVVPGLQTLVGHAKIIPTPDLPGRSKPVRGYHPTTWLRIEITEGKKHQVRRMTAAVGFPTLRLVRVSIGKLHIGNLEPGKWCYLTKEESENLIMSSVSR